MCSFTTAPSFRIRKELALLDPVAAQVTGHRYADMDFTSAGRE
jgi:hypothetical protein